MRATVYRLYERGMRLPRPKQGVKGWLTLNPWRDGYKPELKATLSFGSDASAMVIPELHCAHVRKITGAGLVIRGVEVVPRRNTRKSAVDSYAQTWWCLVHTADDEYEGRTGSATGF